MIGRRTNDSNFFPGKLTILRIWNQNISYELREFGMVILLEMNR